MKKVVQYKFYLQFNQRIVKLQINDTWSINPQDNYAILTFLSETHFVPKYKLFVDQSLRFTLIIYGWMLPEDYNLYLKFEKGLYNLSLSNLIREIEHLNLCVGITQRDPSFLINFQKHIVIHVNLTFLHLVMIKYILNRVKMSITELLIVISW